LKTSSELPDGKSFLAFSIKLGKLWRIMENPWNIASLASIHNPRLAFRPGRLHDSQERDRCKDLLSLQSKEIATLKARHNDGPDISAFFVFGTWKPWMDWDWGRKPWNFFTR
jgi:hypothetical protein